ncbi:MAG: NFACT family protein [Candidatus Diapherotrites archaeon]|nr:NFACT family protein [Candidatus Diapherotrites archaeon]
MELTNLALAYQLKFLEQELVDGHVNKIQELPDGGLRIKIHTLNGTRDLVVSAGGPYLTEYRQEAKKNPTNFALALGQMLFNKKIERIEQPELDRVCVLGFSGGALRIEFFPQFNIVLVDADNHALVYRHPFRDVKRVLRKGEPYPARPKPRQNPQTVEPAQLESVLKASAKDIVRTLMGALNSGPLLVETILEESGVPKMTPASEISPAQLKKIALNLHHLHEIDLKKMAPFEWNGYIYPALIGTHEKGFESVNAVLNEPVSRPLPPSQETARHQDEIQKLRKSMEEQQRVKEKLEQEILENQQKGQLIYEHFIEIQEILDAIAQGKEKKKTEKEIMEAFAQAARNKNKTAAHVKSVSRDEIITEW